MSNEPVPETKSVSAFSCRLSNGTSDDSTVISVPWMRLYSSAWEAINSSLLAHAMPLALSSPMVIGPVAAASSSPPAETLTAANPSPTSSRPRILSEMRMRMEAPLKTVCRRYRTGRRRRRK